MRRALEVLGLGLLALACSLPLVTLGASAAALYYALAKSVRRGRGSPWREFFLNDPEHPYAFVVLVEHAGGGRVNAGPVANALLQAAVAASPAQADAAQ